jgi:cobalt/nickel transport system permease protein
MALVVAAQCLVFADGGVGVLGANLLNMALLAALPAVIVREYFVKDSLTLPKRAAMYFTAAVLSVVLAATACSVELSIAGVMPLAKVLPAMLFVHLLIGLGEAALTFAACYLLIPQFSMVANSRSYLYPLGAAAVAALMISPFACSSPDGLEWVAQTLGFLKEAAPMFVTPFADYTVPAVSSAGLSTAFAGMFGVVLMFAAAFGVRKLFR